MPRNRWPSSTMRFGLILGRLANYLTTTILLNLIERAAAYPSCSYSQSPDRYTLHPNILFYTASDGTPLYLDAYVPNFVERPPLLEMIHGGGFLSSDRSHLAGQAAYFANQGFAVINIDYRPIPNRAALDHFAVQLPDARCALRWAIANAATYRWDSTKLGVTGMSGGATLAADVGLTGGRGFSLDRMTPLDSTTCPFEARPYVVKAMNLYSGVYVFGGESDSAADYNASPVSYVTPRSPPTFLENGSDDMEVPPVQSKIMANTLTEMRVPHLYFELRGQGHYLVPQSRGGPGEQAAPWCYNVFWLHRMLGG